MRLFCTIAALSLLSGCLAHHRGAMPKEPAEATWLEVNGTRVRYLDQGEGPTVVLLHGFASSLETWTRVTPALKGRRTISVDLKGFGWTDRPEGDYSPTAQSQLIEGLLEQRGVKGKIDLVAHSWGSSVALQFALRNPEKLNRLALYDAYVYEEQLPTFFHLAKAPVLGEALFGIFYDERPDERMSLAFYDPEVIPEALIEDVERSLERPGTRAAALAAVRGMKFKDVEADYAKISVPTLLLWGREDRVTPVKIGERLLRQLPNAKMVTFARCGHLPMLEAANESTRALAAFLEEAK